jgi:membrane dipeptidase
MRDAMGLAPIVDLHEDLSYHFMMNGLGRPLTEDVPERQVDLPKYRRAGVKLVLASIFPLQPSLNAEMLERDRGAYLLSRIEPTYVAMSPRDLALEHIKFYYTLAELYDEHLELVTSPEALEALPDSDRVGLLLHLEGTEALAEPEDLKLFYRLGVRSLGLTWNYDTKYAASCLSKKDYGLTGEGERLVRIANSLHVMIDLSHAGPRTCAEVLELSEDPPFFSHANAAAITDHPRNVGDELLRHLGRRKGIVGVTFIRACIGEPFNARQLALHALHIARTAGAEALALGTDLLGFSEPPEDLRTIEDVHLLGRELKAGGMDQAAIDGLLGDNALRYISSCAEGWARNP